MHVYGFSASVAGAAAAQTFLSLFNLTSSPVRVSLLRIMTTSHAVVISITNNPLAFQRISAASGGALQAAGSMFKYRGGGNVPNPLAEVRLTNPTITLVGFPFHHIPPVTIITAIGGVQPPPQVWTPPPILTSADLFPGEGIAIHQTVAGLAAQVHRLTIDWGEERILPGASPF